MPDLQQFENPIIIIEGDDLYSHREIHPNAIRGALASIATDHGYRFSGQMMRKIQQRCSKPFQNGNRKTKIEQFQSEVRVQ